MTACLRHCFMTVHLRSLLDWSLRFFFDSYISVLLVFSELFTLFFLGLCVVRANTKHKSLLKSPSNQKPKAVQKRAQQVVQKPRRQPSGPKAEGGPKAKRSKKKPTTNKSCRLLTLKKLNRLFLSDYLRNQNLISNY